MCIFRACALGQASSSIMARNIIGATIDELRDVRDVASLLLKANGAAPEGKWEYLKLLEPLRDYKARHAEQTNPVSEPVEAAAD